MLSKLLCVVTGFWGFLREQAKSMNLVEVLFVVILSVGLFFLGQLQGKRTERRALTRYQKLEELMKLHHETVQKKLEAEGYTGEQIQRPEVQDAIRLSANTIVTMWKGPLTTGVSIYPPEVLIEDGKEKEED